MRLKARLVTAALLLLLMLAGGAALVRNGIYGWTIFVVAPLCLGALSSWTLQPQTRLRAIGIGAATGVAASCSFLYLGLEGFICVAMSLPLVVPLAAFGSWLAYRAFAYDHQRTVAMALLLPASFFFDTTAKPPVYAVKTSLIVNAPPQRVWKFVVAFPDIPDPKEWYFRTGLAYPTRTRIEGAGVGAERYCDLSTGPVVERVIVWDEPHRLKFSVTSTPAAMHELGLYGRIYPRHLNGYYIAKQGQFTLTELPNGRTLLEGTSWYQHGLWPAQYWRCWCDLIIHRIHWRVLAHIRTLSEANSAP